MKKTAVFLVVLLMIFGLAACGSENQSASSQGSSLSSAQERKIPLLIRRAEIRKEAEKRKILREAATRSWYISRLREIRSRRHSISPV